MTINWEFVALVVGITGSTFSVCSYLWKVTKFLGAKSKSVDTRINALYEAMKIQSVRLSDIAEHLSLPEETRGSYHKRKSLERLEDGAFKDYDNEHTGFN